MSMCTSAILMAALTTGLVLSDISFSRSDRVITHFILGGIVSFLFYSLCSRGYEGVNWVLLSIVPVYMILSWFSQLQVGISREPICHRCKRPESSCRCPDVLNEHRRQRCNQHKSSRNSTAYHSPKEHRCRKLPPYEDDNGKSNSAITLGCPAKPISLATECGISRYT
jgi:hypothetical protein